MTPRRAHSPRRAFVPALLAALCLFSACSETVDPFIDAGRYFSLYGYLDTDRDTQYVRVIPLRRRVDLPPPGPLDATVVTTDLVTGEQRAWRDSLVTFSDGTTGNVFFGVFRPHFGHRYRIEVRDEAGNTASAETTVPDAREATIGPVYTGTTLQSVSQDVLWPDVDFVPARVQAWYRFAPDTTGGVFRDVVVNYNDVELGRQEGGDWRITTFLLRDVEKVLETLGQASPPPLYNVGMKVSVTSDDWRPPGGKFDFEVLIQPGTFSNVEGGFGFFGSVAQLNAEWTLPRDAYTRLGYPHPAR